ncbi:MAG: hypothetical protein PHY54_19275, partial [Methylococcales bacterium]|nr:hypothetical protein [Methylococcales bacterium]
MNQSFIDEVRTRVMEKLAEARWKTEYLNGNLSQGGYNKILAHNNNIRGPVSNNGTGFVLQQKIHNPTEYANKLDNSAAPRAANYIRQGKMKNYFGDGITDQQMNGTTGRGTEVIPASHFSDSSTDYIAKATAPGAKNVKDVVSSSFSPVAGKQVFKNTQGLANGSGVVAGGTAGDVKSIMAHPAVGTVAVSDQAAGDIKGLFKHHELDEIEARNSAGHSLMSYGSHPGINIL